MDWKNEIPGQRVVEYQFGQCTKQVFEDAYGLAQDEGKAVFIKHGNFAYMIRPDSDPAGEVQLFEKRLYDSSAYKDSLQRYEIELTRAELRLGQLFDDMKQVLSGDHRDVLEWLIAVNDIYAEYGNEFEIDAPYVRRYLRLNGFNNSLLSLEEIQSAKPDKQQRHLIEYAMNFLHEDFDGLPQALVAKMQQVLDFNLAKKPVAPSATARQTKSSGAQPRGLAMAGGRR